MKYFLISIVSLFLSIQPHTSTYKIIEDMLISIRAIKTIKYKVKDFERLEGKLNSGEENIKMNINPFKLYVYMVKPDQGLEVLWVDNENNGKARIHLNSFPYININLDPNGALMRKGGHHSIFDLNLNYIATIISDLVLKSKNEFDQYFIYKGEIEFNHRKCHQVVINFKDFKYIKYQVKKDETLVSIAKKYHLNEQMIFEKNSKIKSYEDVKEGDIIYIPNAYAAKTILYIDKETNLPIVQEMYDEIGLYERYEYYNVEVNIPISSGEFKEDYKDYHF